MEMSCSAAGSTCGGSRMGAAMRMMERLDADRSGGLTATEAAATESGSRLATGFSRIDADGNGTITRDELKADVRAYRRDGTPRDTDDDGPQAGPAPSSATPQSLFEALVKLSDSNGDLRLSADEVAANPLSNLLSPAFAGIDTDQDGLLTSREVDAFETAGQRPAPAPESLYESLVKTTDADGDLRLSAQEIASNPLSALLSPSFDGIDTDKDGLLNSREVDAFETARNAPPAPPAPAPAPAPAEQGDASAIAPDPAAPATPAEAATGPSSTTATGPDTGTTGTYATPRAVSLYESLFHALAAQPGADSVTLSRDLARDFLRSLADIA